MIELKILALAIACLLMVSQLLGKKNRPVALAGNTLFWIGGVTAVIQLPDPSSTVAINVALGLVVVGLALGICWTGLNLWSPFKSGSQQRN
jgi:hypothetical protein